MLADELLQIRLRNQLRRRMPDKFARLRRGYGGQAAELKLAHRKSVRVFQL